MSGRRRVRKGSRALFLVGLVVLPAAAAGPGSPPTPGATWTGLGADDVAGSLNGETIRLAEVDEALDGALVQRWAEHHRVVRAAARAICEQRAQGRLAAAEGTDLEGWRAQRWTEASTTAAEARRYVRASPEIFPGDVPSLDWVAHRLRVTRYRDALRELAASLLSGPGGYEAKLPPAPVAPRAEPVLPPVVARCLGAAIRAEEVERFAAFPVYRRRAEIVTTACRQFEIDYSNPLLLRLHARAEGVPIDELMRRAEGEHEPLEPAEIEASARERYPKVGPEELAKAEMALDAKRRLDRRMAFLEGVRQTGFGSCALTPPAPPTVFLRGEGISRGPENALRVALFTNFRCRHCAASWETFTALRDRFGDRVRLEVRHHFPDTVQPFFTDAVRATCQAEQGRFWQLATRLHADRESPDSSANPLDLDEDAYEECLESPRIAVRVLADVEEAQRLGFGEAMPSWVIGSRPRRGFQGPAVVGTTVEEQLDATGGSP